MSVTAATLVSAFESVGSILVIAMLIAPAATAHLLTDRLGPLLGISLAVAALSVFLRHLMAITVPALVFGALGYPEVVDTNTTGMMAVAAGLLFVVAALFGPRYGVISKQFDQVQLSLSIIAEDILGLLYRREEETGESAVTFPPLVVQLETRKWSTWLALRGLLMAGEIARGQSTYGLTDLGRERAKRLVRGHRLWEGYLAKHFELPNDHLHESAARVEHFIGLDQREILAAELDGLEHDPHGRAIPPEQG